MPVAGAGTVNMVLRSKFLIPYHMQPLTKRPLPHRASSIFLYSVQALSQPMSDLP
jgi:hypothetical protein